MKNSAVRVFVVSATLSLSWLISTATPASARDCSFDLNRLQIDASEIYKSLRCLVTAVNRLERENARLKTRVAALEDVARQIPVPWANIDGVISQTPDRPIEAASFLLTSRSTGGANALEIDQDVLEELCDKIGGCTMTIALKAFNLFERKPENRVISGPCRLSYTADSIEKSTWAVGAGCGVGPLAGVDGDGGLDEGEGNSAEIALAGGACILADSGLENAAGNSARLASDRNEGLFLLAIPALQSERTRRFQCELSLE
ncbi:MAG: hypothetical protein ABJF50_19375 [Paracoccaceae bacterium]